MKSSDSASIDLKANPKNLKIELRLFIRRLSDERSMFRNSSDHLFGIAIYHGLLGALTDSSEGNEHDHDEELHRHPALGSGSRLRLGRGATGPGLDRQEPHTANERRRPHGSLLQTVTLDLDADNVRYDSRSQHIVVGYGGEKFLAGKVTRPGGGGALAILDTNGKQVGNIDMDAHPESFQLEKVGTRVFVNVPDRQEVEVADLAKGTVLARWPVTTCTTNFPMSLDETHHRLFVGCRMPARLVVFDTESGKIVASPATVEHTDDLFYDAGKGRIYVLGEGFIDVWRQMDPDHYDRIGRVATPPDSRTGLFVPDLGELFETTPHHGAQGAQIGVYSIQ